MKLRFSVKGPKGVPDCFATIEVVQEDIAPDVAELITQRLLNGVDVCYGGRASKGKIVPGVYGDPSDFKPFHLQAEAPTWESLVSALRKDDALLKEQLDKEIQDAIGRD